MDGDANGSADMAGYDDDDFFKSYPAPASDGAAGGGGDGDDPFNAFFGDGPSAQGEAMPMPAPAEGADAAPGVMHMPPPEVEKSEKPEEPETMMPDAYGAGGAEPMLGAYPGMDAPLQMERDEDQDSDDLPPSRPETPRAIREWRVDFSKRLEAKKAQEDEMRAKNLADSKATIEGMYARWQERCNANKQLNTEEENRFIAERDALQAQFSAPGEKPNWNMIPQLANLSGEFKKGQRDTSRMRSVILKLKT
ncbi:hypothetical protein FVE85_3493 [Porphyridium purpureum]|uniref:Clathrin light chain n=1 Tax=Porphyridium purpureum TaxID=35688 RepID=A0A5J4YJC3_PORPP|nr:hypothetical protein FVE85_9627 [Porphyridium purpureum]KAA8492055.1 hypothetical protein FVE85_3493 [Porphyridium purpureum]|eukprot:POR4929..scf267_23